MIKIEYSGNFDEALKRLQGIRQDRWGFYLSKAANDTAFYVRTRLQNEMPKYIKNPVPFTLNSIQVIKGDKKSPEASVRWKKEVNGRSAGRYLIPMTDGVPRGLKGFESLLMRSGNMPIGYYTVPTKDAPLNVFGNVPQAYLNKMLSYLRAMGDPRDNRSYKKKFAINRARFFSVLPRSNNRLPPGIYERRETAFGSAIRPIFFFKEKLNYRAVFPFKEITATAAKAKFQPALSDAIIKYGRQML